MSTWPDVTTPSTTVPSLHEAYAWCEALARSHYENFPVASRLLPPKLRRPVAVIYAFARVADDFADEGGAATRRLEQLDKWAQQLERCAHGDVVTHPVFVALRDVRSHHELPLALFRDLIDAFRQDVTKRRYANFAEVLDYCRRSADPVGRLLLYLNGDATAENLRLSDRICTSLQLINFWQDLGQDVDENDRIYLPQDEMASHGVSEIALHSHHASPGLHALMARQYQLARAMMLEGAPLARRVRGRLGWELRFIVAGGLRVLDRLESRTDPFARPRLGTRDLPALVWSALALPHTP